MADDFRLWFVRCGGEVQGPFPEPLLCRYLAIGRLSDTDEVSQDGSYWRAAQDVPVLVHGVRALLEPSGAGVFTDPEWMEERSRATQRWLDDRKSPDPRRQSPPSDVAIAERRSGLDRRQSPETVDEKVYREARGDFEAWLGSRHERYGTTVAVLALFVILLAAVLALIEPTKPVKVGLRLSSSNCAAEPRQQVDWAGCNKQGVLLVGADLRGAELVGANLRQANFRYADLRGANLLRADLQGAELTGARLDGAIWIDGRICAAGSTGGCR